MGSDESSSPVIDPIVITDDGIEARVAWIWCIQCCDLDDRTTHRKTQVLVVCDSETGEPKHLGPSFLNKIPDRSENDLGLGGEYKIKKPCACRPEKLDGSFIHANRSSPKYVYALTYPHPNTGESLNFAVDFDTEKNKLIVLDGCNFSLNELAHTLGYLFSIPCDHNNNDHVSNNNNVDKNYSSKNLAALLH